MRPFQMFLVALAIFATPPVLAGEQPKEPSEAPEAEADEPLPLGKLRLTIDHGGHSARIRQTLFAPDGKHVITVAADHAIRVWNVDTGRTEQVLIPPGVAGVGPAALSADGRTLAASCVYHDDGRFTPLVCLIDLAVGRLARPPLKGPTGPIESVALSADGKRVAGFENGGGVWLWDVVGEAAPRQLVRINHKAAVHVIAMSPDGQRVAYFPQHNQCQICDTQTARKEAQLRIAQGSKFFAVAWSPDSSTLATAGSDGLRFWSADGTLRSHPLPRPIQAVAFSGNSREVVTVWNNKDGHQGGTFGVEAGKAIARFNSTKIADGLPQPQRGTTIAVSPDGKLAASSGGNDGMHETLLWNAGDGSFVRRLASQRWLSDHPGQVGWGPDGHTVAWRGSAAPGPRPGDRLRTFDFQELQLGSDLDRKDLHGAVHRQGNWKLEQEPGGPEALVRKGNKVVATLRVPGSAIRGHTFLGDDRAAAAANRGTRFVLFDSHTGKIVRQFRGHRERIFAIAPSPDGGRFLASFSLDQTLRLWTAEREAPLLSLYVSGEDWVVWTEEGYYAASPGGERLIGWVVDNGPDHLASFLPAQRFRKHFYRPDLVKLVFAKGSVAAALAAAAPVVQDIARILPPAARLRVEKDGEKVKVEVSADAGSAGQPVTELHLLVDGRPVKLEGGETAAVKFAPGKEKDARATWTVRLEPGTHKLAVRAHGPESYSITEEVSVSVVPTAPTPAPRQRGTLYYVGVGINHFQHHPELELKGAVPDVKSLEQCLRRACASRFDDIRPVVLTDEKATRKAVLEVLAELQAKVKPMDVVIVHYSSHGEVDGAGGLYLLTSDSKRDDLEQTALPGQKLRDLLGQYQSQVLLVLDACHSGKFPLMRPATDPLARLLADDTCGVAVLTAALATQKAEDSEKGGVFTQALVAGLQGKADPDKGSGRLFVHNLFAYVYGAVTQETSNRQMPVYLPSGSAPPIVLKETQP
jgi:WD40 repeat protein